jgi:hypothetical protein
MRESLATWYDLLGPRRAVALILGGLGAWVLGGMITVLVLPGALAAAVGEPALARRSGGYWQTIQYSLVIGALLVGVASHLWNGTHPIDNILVEDDD